ncbi:MAG: PilZ domain-containing protein [bacterium]
MNERRGDERLPVRQVEAQGGCGSFSYRVLNISRSGCAVETSQCLWNEHATIPFELPLPGKVDRLKLNARIVWHEPARNGGQLSSVYGIHFPALEPSSELILDLYLDYLRREIHLARLDEAWRKLQLAQERISMLIACEEKKIAPYLH